MNWTIMTRYLLAVFVLLYTIGTYLITGIGKLRNNHILASLIHLNVYAVMATAFFVLFKTTQNTYYIGYGIAAFLLIFLFRLLFSVFYPSHSIIIKNNICFLITTGFIIVSRLSPKKSLRHIIIVAVAMIIMMIVPIIIRKVKFLRELSLLFAIFGLVILGFMYFWSKTTNGAIISLQIGPALFQPTEIIKIVFVMFLASFLAKGASTIRVVYCSILVTAYVMILVLSKDLGSAAIFCVVFVCVVFIATGRKKLLFSCVIFGCVAIVAAYFVFDHLKIRVDIWIDPWQDVERKGYQIVQSLFSISNGKWFGTGLMQGKPHLIPFVESDMVYSVISEELGSIYGICLILVFFNCFLFFIATARRLYELFYKYTAFCLGISMIFQTLLTIGGGTKYIPLTGITLPFISYGGSSLLATGIIFAVAQGLYLITQDEFEEVKKNELCDAVVEDNRDYKIDRHIFEIFMAIFLIFLGLIVHIIMLVTKERESILRNEYNVARVEKSGERTIRGSIYSRDNELIAFTDRVTNERIYPYKEAFAHVIGYCCEGKSGIEALCNYDLSMPCESGLKIFLNDFEDKKGLTNSVVTTMDVTLQEACYNALGNQNGAIVMMNPKTGEILAMVSTPSFDPNHMDEVLLSIAEDKNSSILLNRATQGKYTPGSVFKLFTTLEYIRENPDTYDKYKFLCNGEFQYDKYAIHCYHRTKHGEISIEKAFAYSCNCFFGSAAMNFDRESFFNTLESCLFNNRLPFLLSYEKSYVDVKKSTEDKQMVQIGIGQSNTYVTPLHIALITSCIANKGTLMKPYLVQYVQDNHKRVVQKNEPSKYGTLMSEEEAALLTTYMRDTVLYGTGKKIKKELMAAGKTGTAEYSGTSQNTHAWFTGFAPYDDPQIVITVIVEDAGSGSTVAVPIASELLEIYFSLAY